MRLTEGTRVRLKPVPEEDLIEQFGEVQEEPKPEDTTVVIRLEEKYWADDDNDDGIRDVPLEQVELA